jgi:hypothetical protein
MQQQRFLSVPVDETGPARRSAAGERRAEPRYACPQVQPVRLVAKPSFRAYRGFLREVSFRGLGLLVEGTLEVGAVLAVQLRSEHTRVSGILTATVRHTTPLPDGTCLVGCSLNRPLSNEELRALL